MGEEKLLAKLGEYSYMKRLISCGEIYMTPIAKFRSMEETDGIGDKYENSVSYSSPKSPTITIKFPWGEELQLDKKSRVTYGEISEEPGLIYCLTSISPKMIGTITALEEIQKIGVGYDTMILFKDTPEFLRRIEQKLKEFGYEMYYGFVEYYSETNAIHKELTPFHKRERFSYQHEYRIYIECNNQNPLTIHIGNLEDIAYLIRLPNKKPDIATN